MATKGRVVKTPPKLLWIGDAVAHTGFASVSHGILDNLYNKYDVHVLGINYFGDPHEHPYRIYPAATGGDMFGVGRLPALLNQIKPHIVCIINDPWLVKDYLPALEKPVFKTQDGQELFTSKIAYMPIDGLNIQPGFVQPLNALDHAIFYTQFGLDEARKSGLTLDNVSIIPHAINTNDFAPLPKAKAREKLNALRQDWFIVGCVNRNQPRKRIDLALEYFAEWSRDKPDTVKFYYHGAIRDVGWDILQLADYYGIQERLIITSPNMGAANGVTRDVLRNIYCSFDVQITTTEGEG